MRELMEKVMNEIKARGAEGDITLSSSKSLRMSAQNGDISDYKVSGSRILGVRLIKDSRVGMAYSESLDPDSLKLLVKQAIENAENSRENPHEKITSLPGDLHDDMAYPEDETSIDVKTDLALRLESEVKKRDKRVSAVPYNSFSENEYQSLYLSSSGRFTSYSDKAYSITSSALMSEEGKKANYYDYHSAHTFKELDFEKVISTSLFHAQNILREEMLPTGKYSVMFSEDSLKSLIECFSNLYSAKSAIDKLNPWANSQGEKVISMDLTITDEPQYQGAFRRSLFDSEGYEQKNLTLIRDGVLESFYHNTVTASLLGTRTTGHAAGGPGSPLGVSGTHMVIRGKNVQSKPDRYLEVIQIAGLHSGANRVSGSFSFAVKGYLWENGKRIKTFGNCTLSGNILELLKRAEVVGEDLRSSTDKSFFSVPLIFHELSIAGA